MSLLVKLGVAGLVLGLSACSSSSPSIDDGSDAPVAVDESIVHGAKDGGRHPAVVALYADLPTPHLCTGALIARDVVLTARHCVGELLSEGVSCPAREPQVGRTMDPRALLVLVSDEAKSSAPVARGKAIVVPQGDVLCDHDFALVTLDRPIPSIAPLRVSRDRTLRVGSSIVAVGYGQTSNGGASGERRFRSDVPIVSVTASELTVGESTCFGDSGGPAIDEQTGEIVGVLSRGGGTCAGPRTFNVYTRVTAFLELVDRALHGDGQPSAPSSDTGDLGDPCSKGQECATGVCVAAEPKGYCSRACGDGKRCPAGYRCAKTTGSTAGVCARRDA